MSQHRCPAVRAAARSAAATAAMFAMMLPPGAASVAAQPTPAHERVKRDAIEAIEARRAELIELADQIWRFAETALREERSSALLADYAERQGFSVTRGVAGLPTAFVAEYGQGSPVIGIMGEYDALPGLSQQARPVRTPLDDGAAGHGCGHNLFGPASLGAALAVRQLIADGRLAGTVRFYGTPAEETVGGKIYMAREGLFRDVDVMLAWHPDTRTRADTGSNQAVMDLAVEFRGRTAHAAADPWNGRSAADAAEAFTFGINLLREHVQPTVRMHYTVQKAGDVPNVVPEHARVWLWVRDGSREGIEVVLERVREIADGAARIAGVESVVTVQGGDYELLVNTAGAALLDANLRWLPPVEYTPEEEAFARELQEASGVDPLGMDPTIVPLEDQEPEGGSTDVGDVSWLVPTLHLSVATAPEGVPWHAWPVVAASGTSIGHKGMLQAARALAATMVDLFSDTEARARVRAEFEDRTAGFTYRPYVPDGPPPLP